MLYQINHDYKAVLWCGIAALATITGQPTSECRESIAAQRRRPGERAPRITGIYNREIEASLQRFGYRADIVARFKGEAKTRPTLAAWLRSREGVLLRATLLIVVGHHYVVIEGKRFVDSRHRDPVFIRDASCRRARVWRVYIVGRAG